MVSMVSTVRGYMSSLKGNYSSSTVSQLSTGDQSHDVWKIALLHYCINMQHLQVRIPKLADSFR